MHDLSPLYNKAFICTCSDKKADKLGLLLKKKGARLIKMPLITIGKSLLTPGINFVLEQINSFDWLFFTSGYGVDCFFDLMHQLKINGTWKKKLKYAVIGKATAETLSGYGIEADYISDAPGAEQLAVNFLNNIEATGLRILFPAGNLSGSRVSEILKDRHELVTVTVYHTHTVKYPDKQALNLLSSGNYDMILFLSPSAFNSFMTVCHPVLRLKTYRIGCLGPATAGAVISSGLDPDFIGEGRGIVELVRQLEKHYCTSLI
ncbi:MAG: uroporphyrinogen-III synthase [Chlorobi bacterium]|nr:uroporphyrinogen-III synthase [Chlorobiota bacterium]